MKKGMLLLTGLMLLAGCRLKPERSSSPATVYLDFPRPGTSVPLLKQEIVRQASVMSYRDEGGMSCRDAVLGDPLPDQVSVHLIPRIQLEASDQISFALQIAGSTNNPASAVFSGENYRELLSSAEKHFSEVPYTRDSQTPRRGNRKHKELSELSVDSGSLPDLFEALRIAHAVYAQKGESPEVYDVIVRGYANLGVMTSHLWNPAYKVYQARALLYAQKFVRTHPEDARAYFLRAYAFGLCGLHQAALDDFSAGVQQQPDTVPEWAKQLDDFLHFRSQALVDANNTDSPFRYTAGMMALLSLEYTPFVSRTFDLYKSLGNKPRVDLRTFDQLNDIGGVSALHLTTTLGFLQMFYMMQYELPKHELLPQSVRESLPGTSFSDFSTAMKSAVRLGKWPGLANVPALHQALIRETGSGQDPGEPSYAAFGSILKENMFVVVAWRQHFMNDKWSVDVKDFTQNVLPYIKDHRYQNLLSAYAEKRRGQRDRYVSLLKDVDIAELPAGGHLFFTAFYDEDALYGSEKGQTLRAKYLSELDETHRDLQREVDLIKDKNEKTAVARRMLAVSPYSPYARRILLEYNSDWEVLGKQYEKDGNFGPELSQVMGWKYGSKKQYAKAIPYYEQAVAQIKEGYVYRALADCYLKVGREDDWLRTLEETLSLPDYKLDHANTRKAIATHFMKSGDIARASVYADASARSYAQWALSLAEECAAASGDFPKAQKLLKNEIQRYSRKDVVPWEMYYKARIYQIAENEEWFSPVQTRISNSLSSPHHQLIEDVFCGLYSWREKDFEKAAGYFHEAFRKQADVWYSILEALVWLDAGNQDRYIQTLDNIIDGFDSTKDRSSSRRQIRTLAICMKNFSEQETDPAALVEELRKIKNKGTLYPVDYFFFAGKYLALLGQEDDAVKFLYKGVLPGQIDRWAGPFLFLELQDRGINPFDRYVRTE
jgi:tetratricopeptide (TPR) repeat protein